MPPKIAQTANFDNDLAQWNDRMFKLHRTPYEGIAGKIEYARVEAILEFAGVGPHDRVLEIGCESGRLLSRVPLATRLVGFDISSEALKEAIDLFSSLGRKAEFFQGDAQNPLPFAPGEFSVVICSEMLEHVKDPAKALAQIHRLADAGTRVVLSVPTERPKMIVKKMLRLLGLFKLFFPKIEPEQSEWHLQFFSKAMLNRLLAGKFRLKRTKVVWFNHYVVLLEKMA